MKTLMAAAMLLALVGGASGHLSVICTTTSKQQPNTFAFWFITYDHQQVGQAPGMVHIKDPSGETITGQFGNVCKPPSPYIGGTGHTVSDYENVLKTSCLGLTDANGLVPVFSDSAIECYNADNNSPLPDYALGLSTTAVINSGYTYEQRDFYFVILDNQYVKTGSYVTWFTGVDQNLDACSPTLPCSLYTKPWTFEVSVITSPPMCTTAPPSSLTQNTVPASLVGCDGASRTIEAGMLCHAQCLSGYGKVGVLECIDQGDGTAAWNPNFMCSSSSLCSVPTASNSVGLDAAIVGVAKPCEALTPTGTECQYTCTGFDGVVSAGKISCESDPANPGKGIWKVGTDYDGCAWTIPPTPAPVPDHWPIGCYVDQGGSGRLFPKLGYTGGQNSREFCVTQCSGLGYSYAGVQFGGQCWCGNSMAGAERTLTAACEVLDCPGDHSEKCGDGWRVKVWALTQPATAYTPVLEGCYEDDMGHTKLPVLVAVDAVHMTSDECATICQTNGYKYAGTQGGKECRCGNDLSTSKRIDIMACNAECAGDSTQKCGGYYRNSVYSLAAVATPYTPVLEGCFKDSGDHANLKLAYRSTAMTVAECTKTCQHNGHTYAAIQGGQDCFCGDDIATNVRTTISECMEPCNGNSSEYCGDAFRNQIYALQATPAKPAFTYKGCFRDYPTRRLPVVGYVDKIGNVISECQKTCQHNGYKYAGLQFGMQCWCGNSMASSGSDVGPTYCNFPCTGDSSTMCGGGWKNQIYSTGI